MNVSWIRVNDFDLSAVTNEVIKWQSHDKFAVQDVSRRDDGVVLMVLENVFSRIPQFTYYEIHKLGRKRFFGTKTFWVIQLYTAPRPDGPLEKRGCVFGKMLVTALRAAQRDVELGYLSVTDFGPAVEAMMN